MTQTVPIGSLQVANDRPFTLIAGPCQIESRDHALSVAGQVAGICDRLDVPLIFKSSFDKANRTSASAARGVGLDAGLAILRDIREQVGCPVLTDVHDPAQCGPVAEAVDVLQIPAFLCRQTDLLLAAAATGKAVNVKKGQFLAPWDMPHVAAKIAG
ncbi:MAG: 3-deoxy-8-phosphooctulonate synthase, partial [Pseudomonadota bacterium]|nr:3-deoxy-8-phosphooctulonate synthase [Pseudomonadota bacterium]